MKKQIIKLLQDNPHATEVVREWFLNNLRKGIDKDMGEEFAKFIMNQKIGTDKLATMIHNGPSGLIYVFDDNDIFINVVYQDEVGFVWDMGHPYGGNPSIPYNTRMKAEHKAIFKAMEILEEKLKPKNDEKSEEKS